LERAVVDRVVSASQARVLAESSLRSAMRISLGRTRETHTEGWYRAVASLQTSIGVLEVWFDRWPGADRRSLWYGIASRDQHFLRALSRRLRRRCGDAIQRGDADADDHGFKDRLQRSDFGRPVLELYSSGRSYYGVYLFPGQEGQSNQVTEAIARSVVTFASEIVGKPSVIDGGGFPEGMRQEKLHLRQERSREVVRLAKLRALMMYGRLSCEACGFDFGATYGEMGRDFIEAHHLVPISSLTPGSRTRIDDLALVCANCHRMLHRTRPWLGRADLVRLVARAAPTAG
jgi:hypothetical protein